MSEGKREIKNNRRDILKMAGRAFGVAVTAPMAASLFKGYSNAFNGSHRDSSVDPSPVTKREEVEDYSIEPLIIDTELENVRFKLHGVLHTRDFASHHFDDIEGLVKDSSAVVSEGSIEDLKKPENSNDGKAYFGTITELCAKYGKPIIYLDSRSFLAIFAESITSQLGVVLGGMASFKIIKPDMTKRSFAKYSLITALGAYAFLGGFSSMPLKSMLAERLYPPDELMRRLFEAEPYFFSHIVDQRNVQITSRLKQLPGILPAEDFNNGDYILATFGAAHIIGIDFYLRNPAIHKVKSAAYAANYDLIDSDEIAKYVSEGGKWTKMVL